MKYTLLQPNFFLTFFCHFNTGIHFFNFFLQENPKKFDKIASHFSIFFCKTYFSPNFIYSLFSSFFFIQEIHTYAIESLCILGILLFPDFATFQRDSIRLWDSLKFLKIFCEETTLSVYFSPFSSPFSHLRNFETSSWAHIIYFFLKFIRSREVADHWRNAPINFSFIILPFEVCSLQLDTLFSTFFFGYQCFYSFLKKKLHFSP